MSIPNEKGDTAANLRRLSYGKYKIICHMYILENLKGVTNSLRKHKC